jgi:bifunctional DNA-binding transcriptional regulator/antitoxin component of YhaV-PrlF toxin-antitoxin module
MRLSAPILALAALLATAMASAQEDPKPAPKPPSTEEQKAQIDALRQELDALRAKEKEIRRRIAELAGEDRRSERLRPVEPAPPPAPGPGDPFADMRRMMSEMEKRMEEMHRRFAELGDRDDIFAGPGVDIRREDERVSITQGPDGVKVTITRTEDGEEVTESYAADSMEELLASHPELKDRGLGGMRFGWIDRPGVLRWQMHRLRPPTLLDPNLDLHLSPLRPTPGVDPNRLGVYVSEDPAREGLVIESVEPKSIAEKLGLQEGDVLLKLNDRPVKQASSVRGILQKVKAGEEVRAEIRRGDQTLTLSARKPGKVRGTIH